MASGAALGASFVDFRLFVVPWVALAPLLAIVEHAPPRRALRLGWLAGATGVAIAFSWLIYAMRVFGGFPLPVALLLYAPLVAWMGLELGIFGVLLAWIGPLPLGLAAPLAFGAVEFLFPSFFPWRLAHSQYRVPVLLQTGELAGPALLGFAIVWVNAAIATTGRALGAHRAARRRDTTPPPTVASARARDDAAEPQARARDVVAAARARDVVAGVVLPIVTVVALVGFGAWRLTAVRAVRAAAPVLRVGVVQGNISIERKGDRAFFGRNMHAYRDASRAIADDVDLLIWPRPSSSTASRPSAAVSTARTIRSRARRAHSSSAASRSLAAPTAPRVSTTAPFFAAPTGACSDATTSGCWCRSANTCRSATASPRLRELSPATSDFAVGGEPALLGVGAVARLGALICYEDVIPGPARAAVAKGATLLVNLTNDAWYGDSAQPVQHQALAVWRAVETRRDLVRATNTGLTSVLAATGEEVSELPTFTTATLTADTHLLRGTTVYAAVGDVAAWTIVALAGGALLRRRLGAARPRAPRPRRSRRRARARR